MEMNDQENYVLRNALSLYRSNSSIQIRDKITDLEPKISLLKTPTLSKTELELIKDALEYYQDITHKLDQKLYQSWKQS